MKAHPNFFIGLILLAAGLAPAQEEQTSVAKEAAAARFWTLPRVEQNPTAVPVERTKAESQPTGKGRAKVLTIENETLQASWTPDSGRIALLFKPSKRTFVADGSFDTTAGAAKVTKISDKTFGRGKAIEVSYATGDSDVVMLFPKLPFALFRSSLHNGGKEATVTRTVRPFQASVDLGKPAGQLKTFGSGGLLAPDENPGSYDWLAVAQPQSRNGVVFGWLTHERGDGVLFSKADGDRVRVGAQIDYGHLRLAPGGTAELETLAVGYFDDARFGLEAWADAVAKVYDIHLPPQPVGYCTWYSQPYGGSSDEKHLAEQAAFAATNLAPFGFSVIQIDDHWQAGLKTDGPKRNFTTHDSGPRAAFPAGMKAAADNIKSLGLTPGLWFIPFAGTSSDPFFADHQDWFVKDKAGKPYQARWGGTCLDMTYAGARAHLSNVVHRLAHEWGYQYFKIDGLWTGTATKLNYVNSGYKEDDIGDAAFQNPDKSNLEAFRDGLRLLRKVAGPKVFVLGCNGPQNMRSYGGAMGLVDAMRVGPDNGANWQRLTRGTIFGSRHYFLNGRVWYNDPDPVYVRDSVPLNHAQLICSWVTLSGQLNLSSEWLPGLSPGRLDILKRTMPSHGLKPRPADLFENDPPSLWLLTDPPSPGAGAAGIRRVPRRDVIGVFNWKSTEQVFDYPLERLGLDANTEYVAFDFWQNTLLPSAEGRLHISVPAESCRVLAVRPRSNHPQLLSTSRHITQGIVDVVEERWNEANHTLSGRSKVVGGDAYELRIVADGAADNIDVSSSDKAAGVKAALKQGEGLVRATIDSPASREVSWSVKFK